MGKRVRLTDDSLNSHGSRVLTSGVDTAQYERNPVLLYMHERGKVIGYMKDIEVRMVRLSESRYSTAPLICQSSAKSNGK